MLSGGPISGGKKGGAGALGSGGTGGTAGTAGNLGQGGAGVPKGANGTKGQDGGVGAAGTPGAAAGPGANGMASGATIYGSTGGVNTAFSPNTSTVTVSPTPTPWGTSSTITLQVKNFSGNDLTTGGLIVTFKLASTKSGRGTISAVTDNGNGTYTATFTGTKLGKNSIIATIDYLTVTSKPAVTVTPGPVDLSNSTFKLSSSSVVVGSKITITIQTKDGGGNKETSGGETGLSLTLGPGSTGNGTFSSMTDNGNGTYTVTFTATMAGVVDLELEQNNNVIPLNTTPPTITVKAKTKSPADLFDPDLFSDNA